MPLGCLQGGAHSIAVDGGLHRKQSRARSPRSYPWCALGKYAAQEGGSSPARKRLLPLARPSETVRERAHGWSFDEASSLFNLLDSPFGKLGIQPGRASTRDPPLLQDNSLPPSITRARSAERPLRDHATMVLRQVDVFPKSTPPQICQLNRLKVLLVDQK